MDELFTPDHEIKVTKSPFSAYENEKKIYDGRLTPISIEHIMFKVKRGHVYGADFIILQALNELEFATSRMVTQYLSLKGISMAQIKVHNRLKFMNKINIISRFKLVNGEQELNTRIYCLEKAGKYLLMSQNYSCYWKQSDNVRPLSTMKEILARNQVLLTYCTKIEGIQDYKINPSFKLLKQGGYFKPHLLVLLKNEHRIFFEIVRSFEGFEKKLTERLKQYEEFYEYFNFNFKRPDFILVSEDDLHGFEVYKTILKNQITFKDATLLYTTDLRVLGDKTNNTLINYDIKLSESRRKAHIKIINYAPFINNL